MPTLYLLLGISAFVIASGCLFGAYRPLMRRDGIRAVADPGDQKTIYRARKSLALTLVFAAIAIVLLGLYLKNQ